ncbi:uncharacterized protein [Primulina eburnea]|uniref:uncharacterized protein isoform X1 n=1 Tax=Primulina eburnea TaxID=1245227 RepID=UPI003C6C193C
MASMKSGDTPENRRRCEGEAVKFIPNDNIQESTESIESGYCSPPLWKNHNHNCISPNSRLQAIVRRKFELMELVKSMPESSYELSLTDLVEDPKSETRVPQLRGLDNNRGLRRRSRERKISDRITRSESFENRGLLLKMVFPVGLPSKRKKSMDKNVGGRAESLKVCGERDWWKKRFTGSTDSDSSRTSGGRSLNSIRKRNGVLGNCCWPFFQSCRRESAD